MPAGPYQEIIGSLLGALKWKGHQSDIIQARPYAIKAYDLNSFRKTMVNLGFSSRVVKSSDLHRRMITFPSIGIVAEGTPKLLLGPQDISSQSDFKNFIIFQPAAPPFMPVNGQISIRREMHRFAPLLREVVLLSFLIGGIALAPIYFNRALFDHVIASGSIFGLPMLLTGALLALAVEVCLREFRNARLSQFGGRLDHYVSCSVFERLLFLPPLYTERSSVSAQLARLKDFENVREFFTGPLATLFFEMPLIALYLIVMAFLAKWLALIPLLLILAYAVLLTIMHHRLKENSQKAASTGSAKQEFLMETVAKMRDIRLAGLEDIWNERYRVISGKASLASFKSNHTAQLIETCSYVLMSLGGIAVLGFGVAGVIEGSLTVGALIGAMMLVWRIIAPMQICCASITRIQQLRSSVGQVKRLLSLQPEHISYTPAAPIPRARGQITFHRVSLRYSPDTEPALLGVSFEAQPGQIIAIRGSNGSGKSTILKLALGLYRPQNGSVRIDGVDIRQHDPIALRQMISYVPQNVDFFPGTIRENLLFANPVASDDQCFQALEESCAAAEIRHLPRGLDTPLEGEGADNISFLLKQRINLARAYLRYSPIMLFDEASHSLGPENDAAFQNKISSLRGKSTVLLVTHREDHMRMADQLLVMNKGELTHAGLPEQVLTVLRGRS